MNSNRGIANNIKQSRAKISDALDSRDLSRVTDYLKHLHSINPKQEYGKALSILERPTGIIDNLEKMGLPKDSPIFMEFQRFADEKERVLSIAYDEVQRKAEQAKSVEELVAVSAEFWKLGDYRDSLTCAKDYKNRAKQITRKKKRRKIVAIAAAVSVVTIIVLTFIISNAVTNANNYRDAIAYLEAGNYARAAAVFGELGDYRDSREQERNARFQQAEALFADEQFEEAARVFSGLGSFNNARERANNAHYLQAEALLAVGNYAGAARVFESIGEYQDASNRARDITYMRAEMLVEQGNLEEAVRVFTSLGNYRNAQRRANELSYSIAESLFEAGHYAGAANAFSHLGNFSDASRRALDAARQIVSGRTVLDAGREIVVALKSDGTVVAVGRRYENNSVFGTRDIISIAVDSDDNVFGLRSNGTVIQTGGPDVSDWSDIISISAQGTIAGLRGDGTVVVGHDRPREIVSSWYDIVDISVSGVSRDPKILGLRSDGTVVSTGRHDVSGWTDVVAISGASYHSVGLLSNGTVVATDTHRRAGGTASSWNNISAITSVGTVILGMTTGGVVVSSDDQDFGRLGGFGTSRMIAVATTGFQRLFFGLTDQGTVIPLNMSSGNAGQWIFRVTEWDLW